MDLNVTVSQSMTKDFSYKIRKVVLPLPYRCSENNRKTLASHIFQYLQNRLQCLTVTMEIFYKNLSRVLTVSVKSLCQLSSRNYLGMRCITFSR